MADKMEFMMKRYALVLLTLLMFSVSIGIHDAYASTTTSSGKAVIPPFNLHWGSDTDRLDLSLAVTNITDDTVHVKVVYYSQDGSVAWTDEFDVASMSTKGSGLRSNATPGQLKYFFATIEWTASFCTKTAVVAHAYAEYYLQTSSYRVQDAYAIPVNMGLPF